jgi:hypothetical protein
MIHDRDVFFLKTLTIEAKNVRGALPWWKMCKRPLYNPPHGINKPLHPHVECLINSSPSGYTFKMNDAAMLKGVINILLISDFDIVDFFSLGMNCKLFLTTKTFR